MLVLAVNTPGAAIAVFLGILVGAGLAAGVYVLSRGGARFSMMRWLQGAMFAVVALAIVLLQFNGFPDRGYASSSAWINQVFVFSAANMATLLLVILAGSMIAYAAGPFPARRLGVLAAIVLLAGLGWLGWSAADRPALLQPAVVYPAGICVGALGAAFFGDGHNARGYFGTILIGVFVSCAALGLSWLFGAAPAALRQALLFRTDKASKRSSGLRWVIS